VAAGLYHWVGQNENWRSFPKNRRGRFRVPFDFDVKSSYFFLEPFFFAFFLVAMFLFSLSIFHGCGLSKKPQLMNV